MYSEYEVYIEHGERWATSLYTDDLEHAFRIAREKGGVVRINLTKGVLLDPRMEAEHARAS